MKVEPYIITSVLLKNDTTCLLITKDQLTNTIYLNRFGMLEHEGFGTKMSRYASSSIQTTTYTDLIEKIIF